MAAFSMAHNSLIEAVVFTNYMFSWAPILLYRNQTIHNPSHITSAPNAIISVCKASYYCLETIANKATTELR